MTNKHALPKFRVRRHKTIKSIMDTVFGGVLTPRGVVAIEKRIRRWKMWGSVDVINNIVHVWHDGQRTEEELVDLFAHELGHITGKPEVDTSAEEDRADSFATVAKKALRLARRHR